MELWKSSTFLFPHFTKTYIRWAELRIASSAACFQLFSISIQWKYLILKNIFKIVISIIRFFVYGTMINDVLKRTITCGVWKLNRCHGTSNQKQNILKTFGWNSNLHMQYSIWILKDLELTFGWKKWLKGWE